LAETPVLAVYLFKKALLLLHAIRVRFSTYKAIPVVDTSNFPVFSDNVLPSMLVHFGIIVLSQTDRESLAGQFTHDGAASAALLALPSLAVQIQDRGDELRIIREGPRLNLQDAAILRAAAVHACAAMVEYARNMSDSKLTKDQRWIKEITLPELDGWIWSVAKDRHDYRILERFVCERTPFF
jgi:hypothetical protein